MKHIEALSHYIAATNSHDFNNVEPLIRDDAVNWFQDKTYEGIEAIKNYFENTWSLVKDEDYKIDNIRWLSVTNDSALCIYNYHWSGRHEGKIVSGSGNATNVFVNIDKAWVLIHEHLTPL